MESMKDKYAMIIYYSNEDKVWIVVYPELPGCMTHGKTIEEAVKMGEEAKTLWLETTRDQKWPAPKRKLKDYKSVSKLLKRWEG